LKLISKFLSQNGFYEANVDNLRCSNSTYYELWPLKKIEPYKYKPYAYHDRQYSKHDRQYSTPDRQYSTPDGQYSTPVKKIKTQNVSI